LTKLETKLSWLLFIAHGVDGALPNSYSDICRFRTVTPLLLQLIVN